MAAPSASLEYRYHNAANVYVGSIHASVMIANELPAGTNDDPSKPPKQTYTLLPIYGVSTLSTGQTAEGSHATMAGYVESKAGRNFAVVLTWRSKKGKLSKAWKLDDELVALYWFDGRPHPSMRYGLNQPGARNPITLSGLWPDNETRCPLKWETRRPKASNTPTSDAYQPAGRYRHLPVKPPVAQLDDLSCLRVTMHKRIFEDAGSDSLSDDPMPKNQHDLVQLNYHRYSHESLTDAVTVDASRQPADKRDAIVSDLFNVPQSSVRSLPFVDFRIYYKSKAALQKRGLLPDASSSAAHPSSSKQTLVPSSVPQTAVPLQKRPAAPASTSQARPAKRARTQASAASISPHDTAVSGSHHADGLSAAEAAPSLSEAGPSSVRPETTRSAASQSRQIKEEVLDEFDFGNTVDSTSNDLPPSNSTVPISQPSAEAQRTSSTLVEFSKPPTETPAATPTTASALPPHLVPKREERRTSFTPVGNDSADLSMSQSQGGGASLSKEEQARAFLAEEGLEIDDDENVAALLAIGFKTKTRFIRSIRISSQDDRAKLLGTLKDSMGMDFVIFQSYLKDLGLDV